MTRYEVDWRETALAEVVQYWLDAHDSEEKSQIRRATDEADRILAIDPKRDAVHLSEGLWRLVIAPLRLYFAIDEKRRIVDVMDVRLTGT